jgi:antitoxin ParD1/3/4
MADQIQITLDDPAMVEFVRSKVRSGEFASEEDAVREMVAGWQEEQAEIARWELEVIGPAYDEAVAHPETLIPIEDMERQLAAAREDGAKAS